jgi:hypothetical protein
MAMATITKYEPSAWHYVAPSALKAGDLIARVSADGTAMQPRVVMHAAGEQSVLGYPRRFEPTDDSLARFTSEEGAVLIVGHVAPPTPKAPKAAKPATVQEERVAESGRSNDVKVTRTTPAAPKAPKAAPAPKATPAGPPAERGDSLADALQAAVARGDVTFRAAMRIYADATA